MFYTLRAESASRRANAFLNARARFPSRECTRVFTFFFRVWNEVASFFFLLTFAYWRMLGIGLRSFGGIRVYMGVGFSETTFVLIVGTTR